MASDALNFDALAFDANSGVNKSGETAYLSAALSLPAWYFVGAAPDDAPEELEPLIGVVENEPHLFVFTEEPRAESVAARRAGQKGCEAVTLHMETAEAVGYCRSLAEHGVWGVHFNDGEHSVSVQIDRLLAVASRSGSA